LKSESQFGHAYEIILGENSILEIIGSTYLAMFLIKSKDFPSLDVYHNSVVTSLLGFNSTTKSA
jgi:hypothetical protein